jgi:hypothetical protein
MQELHAISAGANRAVRQGRKILSSARLAGANGM